MNKTPILAAVLAAGMVFALASAPVRAAPPEWAGKGKAEARDRDEGRDRGQARDRGEARERGERREARFDDRSRMAVRAYYGGEAKSGRCPPGLAKKHDGCMPPGQAKKWAVGRPLPADVVVYDVPAAVSVQIGVPPSGYKYVRVASDILMVAVGSSMVVDAIEDIGRVR